MNSPNLGGPKHGRLASLFNEDAQPAELIARAEWKYHRAKERLAMSRGALKEKVVVGLFGEGEGRGGRGGEGEGEERGRERNQQCASYRVNKSCAKICKPAITP